MTRNLSRSQQLISPPARAGRGSARPGAADSRDRRARAGRVDRRRDWRRAATRARRRSRPRPGCAGASSRCDRPRLAAGAWRRGSCLVFVGAGVPSPGGFVAVAARSGRRRFGRRRLAAHGERAARPKLLVVADSSQLPSCVASVPGLPGCGRTDRPRARAWTSRQAPNWLSFLRTPRRRVLRGGPRAVRRRLHARHEDVRHESDRDAEHDEPAGRRHQPLRSGCGVVRSRPQAGLRDLSERETPET